MRIYQQSLKKTYFGVIFSYSIKFICQGYIYSKWNIYCTKIKYKLTNIITLFINNFIYYYINALSSFARFSLSTGEFQLSVLIIKSDILRHTVASAKTIAVVNNANFWSYRIIGFIPNFSMSNMKCGGIKPNAPIITGRTIVV